MTVLQCRDAGPTVASDVRMLTEWLDRIIDARQAHPDGPATPPW